MPKERKEIPMFFKTDDLHMINTSLLIELLSFQNTLFELIAERFPDITPEEIDKKIGIHRSRITNKLYEDHGVVPEFNDEKK